MRTPSLCFHRSTGRYFVRLNGKPIYLGYDKRKARHEADRLIGEWLANGRRPASVDADLTIAELLERYRQHVESYYRLPNGEPTSEVACIALAAKPLRLLYGDHPAASFGPLALEALQNRFIEAGWSRNCVNASVDRIRRAFKWGVSKQLVPAAVYEALRTLAGLRRGRSAARETEPIGPVDDATVEATLPHLPATVADMVRVQRWTGARPDEVCAMRVGEVDRSSDVWQYRPGHHKTEHHGRARVILIGPKAQAVLTPYLLKPADQYVFSPQDSERRRRADAHESRVTPIGYGNTIGSNRKQKPKRMAGERYDRDSYRRAVNRGCDKWNAVLVKQAAQEGRTLADGERLFPRWSPNRLRHAAATELRSRFGLEAAQVVLGHADPRITLVYAERDLVAAARFIAAVG